MMGDIRPENRDVLQVRCPNLFRHLNIDFGDTTYGVSLSYSFVFKLEKSLEDGSITWDQLDELESGISENRFTRAAFREDNGHAKLAIIENDLDSDESYFVTNMDRRPPTRFDDFLNMLEWFALSKSDPRNTGLMLFTYLRSYYRGCYYIEETTDETRNLWVQSAQARAIHD